MNGLIFHEVRVSAPGKVILHGEHAVVYGKTAIAVSLGLRTSIVIKERQCSVQPSINLNFPLVDINEEIKLKPLSESLLDPPFISEINTKFPWIEPDKLDHAKHLSNIEKFLQENRPNFDDLENNQKNSLRSFFYAFSGIFGAAKLPVCSIDVFMDSQLTVGAGTGSSASFNVTLSGALIQLVKLKSGLEPTEFSADDQKIISAWAYNCERIMHGTPSGIDNTTCTYGSLVSFRKGSEPRLLDLELDLRVLLVDTRVSRETKTLAAKVAALRQWNTAAVDSIMEACEHVTHTATEILETLSTSKQNIDTEVHYKRLQELWDMNHCLLAALGVSHAALEAACGAARARGLAAKLTGAGGGGCAIVLIPPTASEENVEKLIEELAARGLRVRDARAGGAGVRLHPCAGPPPERPRLS